MRTISMKIAAATLCGLIATPTNAANHVSQNAENVFLPENAILDTAIPFAIGAREAQQELRGSYGWDTFQEGLVEGVYFRFDPDGYARFSPNARLDSDLFEVICRPRTLNCQARKGGLTIVVNGQGQLQLALEGVATGDQFFVADTLSEFELPDRIWQPLDARYENVLAIGGELIVRRGQNETVRISLTGFSAVTSYLRWILAEQDYLALPRNWPVPNSTTGRNAPSLTVVQNWRNNSPQQNSLPTAEIVAQTETGETSTKDDELASLRALVEQMAEQQSDSTSENFAEVEVTEEPATAISVQNPIVADIEFQLVNVMTQIEDLEQRIFSLEQPNDEVAETEKDLQEISPNEGETDLPEVSSTEPDTPLIDLAEQIEFLTNEYGIDPRIAMLLLKLKNQEMDELTAETVTFSDIETLLSGAQDVQQTEIGDVAEQPVNEISELISEPENTATDSQNDAFALLTEYFQSVSQ